MSDELLEYYNQELVFIRELGGEFAKAFPKIAGRLRLGTEATEDPHVARLIEAFALLNARTRHRIDEDFPEIAEAMLQVVYPHYLAPIPSSCIVQFALDRGQADMSNGYTIPRLSPLESEPIEGEPCRFRTCYPVTLWPLELRNVIYSGPPFQVPPTSLADNAKSVMKIEIHSFDKTMNFSNMKLKELRFFLSGQPQYPLYELLHNNVTGIVFAKDHEDKNYAVLDRESIHPVGYERDEGLLPYPSRSLLGYRLLTEYFAFPQKFLFFDLKDLKKIKLAKYDTALNIYIFFNRFLNDLERFVEKETLRLGCTPVINLFKQKAEPINLVQTEPDYQIVPDARRPKAMEVFTVDHVVATSTRGDKVEYVPFYSLRHSSLSGQRRHFWHASRRRTWRRAGEVDHGTDMYITLVDLDLDPAIPNNCTLDLDLTCLNRDLPHRLPFGGGQPRLRLPGGAPIAALHVLTQPTRTRRSALRYGILWKLVSHLSLNHLSVTDEEIGAEALREILRLYDYSMTEEGDDIRDGITSIHSRPTVAPVGHGLGGGFARGMEVRLELDEERFVGNNAFLFGSVLERFFALYCTINSFSRLVLRTKQRGEIRRWPARAGERPLL